MSFSFRRAKKHEDVIVDRVTGAFNRRQLDADIAAGVDTSGHSTATLMINVDEFSSFDGKKGNAKGDQVLERVAWVIMATVRTTDVVYRHEASTFCVLLPSTSDDDAVAVADRISANVARMPLLAECGVSISVGVSSGPANDVQHAVDRAVSALDEAVRTGQPRIFNNGVSASATAAGAPRPLVQPPRTAPTGLPVPRPGGGVQVSSDRFVPLDHPPTATASVAAPMPGPDEYVSPSMPPAQTPFAPPVATPDDALRPPPPPRSPRS